MTTIGPDFISLQVRDLATSDAFYEQNLGLRRAASGPPHAVVFDTQPASFAVREIIPGTELDATAQPGAGIGVWMHAPDAQDIHDALAVAGTSIVLAPFDGPFGRTFAFTDPDGYTITLHSRA
jgi:predicted enzyme related to lactoylglutathione lyase